MTWRGQGSSERSTKADDYFKGLRDKGLIPKPLPYIHRPPHSCEFCQQDTTQPIILTPFYEAKQGIITRGFRCG